MEKKLRQTSRKDGRRALPSGRRARRSPSFTLTPDQVIKACREAERALICAGQVLAVMDLMEKEGWTISELAARSGVSRSHLSDFLRFKKFPTTQITYSVALAFGLKLSDFDHLSEERVAA